MSTKERPEIPKEKIIQVNNKKKIDFSKGFKILYFEWWFYVLTFIPYLFLYLTARGASLWYMLRIEGRKNKRILKKQGCITISNHCHYYDTVFANIVIFPRTLHISVAQRNYEVPVIRRILRVSRTFPIPRRNGLAVITPVVGEALRRKHHVHFLPEGELVHLSQTIHRFRPGAFHQSYYHQAPILPIVYVLKRKKFFGRPSKNPGRVRFIMVFGEPIFPPPLEEDGKIPREKIETMMDRAATWMEETIAAYEDHNNTDQKKAAAK